MGAASSHSAIDSWSTCHSFVQTRYASISTEHPNYIPPSRWHTNDFKKYCSLPTKYKFSAPGTALFQHWLSDFKTNSSFDPWSDFPTWDIMKQYPDISDEENIQIDEDHVISARDYYTLWYTTNITAVSSGESESTEGTENIRKKRGHLTLHGVNYHPIVYFNGELLRPYSTFADRSDEEVDVGGMFMRRNFDLGTWNHEHDEVPLEILVLPPPVVGKPTRAGSPNFHSQLLENVNTARALGSNQRNKTNEPQGQGGDHDLAQSGAVMQCTAGWDWIQPTPDRNIGIWNRVQIDWIWGDVRLHDLRVQIVDIFKENAENSDETTLPVGDDVLVSAFLNLSVTTTLHGNNSREPIKGQFQYEVKMREDETILENGSIENITVNYSASYHSFGLRLHNTKLWWPHTIGSQPLYVVTVKFQSYEFDVEDLPIHESETFSMFGIRTVSSYTDPKSMSLAVKVNGHSIFLTGGNFVTTDQFLRFSTSDERYMQELLHMKNIGLNSIRVWGGGIAETDDFFDAADRLGILVYQEFWMTGDNNGKMAGSHDWPLDHSAYLLNAQDVIVRLRNHPSLIMYGGGNELLPIPTETYTADDSGTSPPRDIDESLQTYITRLDGSRIYVSSSVTDVSNFDPKRSLGPKDGPYGVLNEASFFDRNPGLTTPLLNDEELHNNFNVSDIVDIDSPGRSIGFQTEIGSVSFPEQNSLKRFLSKDALQLYPNCGVKMEQDDSIHHEWMYFKYLPFTENDSNGIDHICQFRYPPINTTSNRMASVDDYTSAAQLAQYFQYKALFEGYLQRIEQHSAVFMWKSSSPAPTFRGALYDWFLETNGGYWGARSGLGGGDFKHARIILNLQDWSVHIANAAPLPITANSVNWNAYSLTDGRMIGSGNIELLNNHVAGNSVTHLRGQIPWLGANQSSLADHLNIQNVLLYRFEMVYSVSLSDREEWDAESTNSYFLTDPMKIDYTDRQSRFALFGAMRNVIPKVKIDASCTLQFDSNVRCSLTNIDVRAAIMIKLSLYSDPPYNESKDSRILPAYFTNSYFTLLPSEAVYVHVSVGDVRVQCSNKSLVFAENPQSKVMLSLDGWNLHEVNTAITCGM